jgi:large repetitive protein
VNGVVTSSSTVNMLGSGFHGPIGVAVDESGNVFVADNGNSSRKEIVAVSSSSTVKTVGSAFLDPHGVAVDGSGNVFIADYGNNAVVELD